MADLLKLTEKSMSMGDRTSMRQANPWSVWARAVTFPFILMALWIHEDFGWGVSLLFLSILSFWIWYNPRAFSVPPSTDNWASKATFGERVLLNRKQVPIPKRHDTLPFVLGGISGAGAVLALIGAVTTQLWPAVCGAILMYVGMLWFFDRMVWLYEDMKDVNAEYRSWSY